MVGPTAPDHHDRAAGTGVWFEALLPHGAGPVASLWHNASGSAELIAAANGTNLSAADGVTDVEVLPVGIFVTTSLSVDVFVVLELCVLAGNFILLTSMGLGVLCWACHRQVHPKVDEALKKGSICVIVPALLDHEHEIILETVQRALALPQPAQVILSYNTKGGDIRKVLSDLEALGAAERPGRLVLHNNATSRSKAANLNGALHLTEPHEVTILLDADHHALPADIDVLVDNLLAAPKSCACMQGAVLVRGDTWWEQILSVFSWYFFNIIITAFETFGGSAMFVGAGAAWRSHVLREYQFSLNMIAEDDDISMRVIRGGYNVLACPQAEVTELAAATIWAFLAQRVRWIYGYEQSLNRHVCGLVCDRPRALLQRLYAWYSYILVFSGIAEGCFTLFLDTDQLPIALMLYLPICLNLVPVCLVLAGMVEMMRRNRWRNWRQTAILLPAAFVYGAAQAFLTLYARMRMICGLEWRVTVRKLPKAEEASKAQPLAAQEVKAP